MDDQTVEPALVIAFDFPAQSAAAVTKQVQETRARRERARTGRAAVERRRLAPLPEGLHRLREAVHHQLVAEAWRGSRPDGQQALHWDDDPENPHVSNIH